MKSMFKTALLLGILAFVFSPQSAQAAVCATSGTTTVTISGTSCTLPSTVFGSDVAASNIDPTNTGTVSIPAGSSITLNSTDTLVYGSSIAVSGSITKIAGAQIKKGAMWVTDADNDRYAANGTLEFNTVRPGTKVRWGYVYGYDVNDGYRCPMSQTMGCVYCANGGPYNVANGTDPYNGCDTANIACANGCIVNRRTGMCNGAGGCATTNAAVASGQLCTGAGSITVGQCADGQPGYTCNGSGNCCYTDIYCIW